MADPVFPAPLRHVPVCPVCGRPTLAEARPFCSRRCADVDLGRWFTEGYAVPAAAPTGEVDDEDDMPG